MTRGVGQPDLHAEGGADECQGVEDVVAIADECQHQPIQPAEPLPDREQVGQRLARVLALGQPVDDRDAGLGGELDGHVVRPRPEDDGIDEPLQVAGHVVDALAGAQDGIVGQVDGVPAELGHPRLEAHPGPEAGLLEEHRQRPPGKARDGMAAGGPELSLDLRGCLVDAKDLRGRQVRHAEQVAAAQGRRRGSHAATPAAAVVSASCTGAPFGRA